MYIRSVKYKELSTLNGESLNLKDNSYYVFIPNTEFFNDCKDTLKCYIKLIQLKIINQSFNIIIRATDRDKNGFLYHYTILEFNNKNLSLLTFIKNMCKLKTRLKSKLSILDPLNKKAYTLYEGFNYRSTNNDDIIVNSINIIEKEKTIKYLKNKFNKYISDNFLILKQSHTDNNLNRLKYTKKFVINTKYDTYIFLKFTNFHLLKNIFNNAQTIYYKYNGVYGKYNSVKNDLVPCKDLKMPFTSLDFNKIESITDTLNRTNAKSSIGNFDIDYLF